MMVRRRQASLLGVPVTSDVGKRLAVYADTSQSVPDRKQNRTLTSMVGEGREGERGWGNGIGR